MKRLLYIPIVFFLACSDDETKENTALKSKLLGKWRYEGESPLTYRMIELSFNQSQLQWKDSIIIYNRFENIDGRLEYGRGSNPVYYCYNDGSTPVPGSYEKNYYFMRRDVNDVLWIGLGSYVYEFYALEDGVFMFELKMYDDYNKHKIGSSTIIFSNNNQRAEFCDVRYYSGYSVYLVFNKISN